MLPHSPDPNEGYNPPQSSKHRRTRSLSSVSIPTGSDTKIALLKGASPLDPRNTVDYTTVGAFTLTGSARMSLRYFVPACFALRGEPQKSYIDSDRDEDSPPASPTSSFASTTPSISRTASDFAEREELEAVARGGLGVKRNGSRNGKYPQIHTVLDSLERGSRVGSGQVVCTTCMKKGTNFPQCKRCTQMWCSRECRVASHRCVTRRGE
ncbi:hypothetical protein DFH06DRAFT_139121 [Mycena polygramma]|nr:hypothetical protein DFH06DRAFT_139121 [Mycena polygramma]